MKQVLLFSISVLIGFHTFGQVSMNAGGASTISGNVSLSYSIGQVFSGTLVNQKQITQGVHQPKLTKENSTKPQEEINTLISSFKARTYPNPAQETVFIEFLGKEEKYIVTISDFAGKDHSHNISWQQSQNNELSLLQINISNLPTGYYLVSIHNSKGDWNGSGFKILKNK